MFPTGVVTSTLSHIAVIGNALPRQCGLATYTTHSVAALRARYPGLRIDHYAMDDGHGVEYGADVHATIAQNDPSAYVRAAIDIERSGAQAIWIHHEFGIFGGMAGDYLLGLLTHTQKPLSVTLHTVLENPDVHQESVMRSLIARASKLIVMADYAAEILRRRYRLPESQICVIEHGAPDRALSPTAPLKAKLGLGAGPLVLTFGLISPDKGLEQAIAALPEAIKAVPNLVYAIVGATHPSLIRQQGEKYREDLIAQAEALGVGSHVRFINEFLDDEALLDYLQACDVYLTPYLNLQQVTSGTLAYALALGRPVVATPYIHAREALAHGVGEIVPLRDPVAITKALVNLLGDQSLLDTRARQVWLNARNSIWPRNAERVMVALADVAHKAPVHLNSRRKPSAAGTIDLTATIAMSDDVGITQHSIHGIPDRAHGYCIDDNARALMLMCQAVGADLRLRTQWARTYAAFVQHAWNEDAGRFRNFMAYDRQWLEDCGSEDSNGRTLWALGAVMRDAPDPSLQRWANGLFNAALPRVETIGSPRALAFIMLGLAAALDHEPGHVEARRMLSELATTIAGLLDQHRKPDWPWFEAVLAYDNARLPQALIEAGRTLNEPDYLDRGLTTLEWIIGQQTAPKGHFRPIGTESFGIPYAQPAQFDQQPLEAAATLDACASAFEATGDLHWVGFGKKALAWFDGDNDLSLPLTGAENGACYDGLTAFGVNLNQGAESTLALQIARVRAQTLPLDDSPALSDRALDADSARGPAAA